MHEIIYHSIGSNYGMRERILPDLSNFNSLRKEATTALPNNIHHVQKVCSLPVNHFNCFYYLEVSWKIVYLLFLKSRIKAFTLSFLSLSIASLTAAEGSHFEIKLVSLQRIKSFWPVPKLQLKKEKEKQYNTIIYTKSITRDYWSFNCFHYCLVSWIIFC